MVTCQRPNWLQWFRTSRPEPGERARHHGIYKYRDHHMHITIPISPKAYHAVGLLIIAEETPKTYSLAALVPNRVSVPFIL
jgi:hypothetical protein